MFGLESQKKKSAKEAEPFFFDLEEDVRDPNKYAKLREKVQNKLLRIKSMLRDGTDQQLFEQLGRLVFGYTAVLKILAKAHTPKKK